jgi:hypothetical protein
VPSNTANFIRASIKRQVNDDAVTDVRKQRASGQRRDNRSSLDDIGTNVDAVFDRLNSAPTPKRLTHER